MTSPANLSKLILLVLLLNYFEISGATDLVPRSCTDVPKPKSSVKENSTIDPDGPSGRVSFVVECDFSTFPPANILHHDLETRMSVETCEAPGCYVRSVKYTGVDLLTAISLVDSASRCTQYMKYECRGSLISRYAWFTTRQNTTVKNYFPGGNSTIGGCKCFASRSCAKEGDKCNCDKNDKIWRTDAGEFENKSHLPISRVHFGDTDYPDEEAFYTLGPLKCYFYSTQATDPCTAGNHMVLSGEEWRSTAVAPDGAAQCDRRLTKGWYKVVSKAGSDMPTTCPPENRCGTLYPIWMKGEIPSKDGLIHDRSAQVHFEGDCSLMSVNIKVKNCGDYRVWYLKPVDICSTAYCFGTLKPCEAGTSSESGYSPCKTDFPKPSQKPILDWEVGSRYRDPTKTFKPGVVFTCKLPNPENLAQNVVMDVEWYARAPGFNRQRVYPPDGQKQIKNATEKAMLFENDLYTVKDAVFLKKPSPFGKWFSCSIRLRFGENKTPGPYSYSDESFAGVQILTQSLTIKEGYTGKILVKLTIPIFNRDTTQTVVSFGLVLPDYQLLGCTNLDAQANKALVLKGTDCRIKLEGITYNAQTWQTDYDGYKKKTFSIPVRTKYDNTYGNKVMSVKFKLSEATLNHPVWSYYTLPDVQVTVVDEDINLKGKVCSSINDPHMRTFDGRYYENQNQGEFILYKHKTIPVQVNAFYRLCNHNKATCNCAVAVRSGKDVFIIDTCRKMRGVIKDYKTRNPMRVGVIGCDKKGMTVKRHGKRYFVTLPTAAQVIIDQVTHNFADGGLRDFINIQVKPSVQDIGQTEGLCGSLNGDSTDDFIQRSKTIPDAVETHPNAFSISWRVNTDESLYDGVKTSETYGWNVYCSCVQPKTPGATGEVKCSYDGLVDTCMTKGKIISEKDYQKCNNNRRRRSTDSLSRKRREAGTEPQHVFEYDKNFVPEVPVWSNGWTEANATDFCTKYIREGLIGKTCSENVEGLDMDGPVENCVKDIHLSGGTEWKSSALGDVKTRCEIEVMKNTSLWTRDPETGKITPPAEILDKLCPDNCSYNGICKNETCQCGDGFGGEDCTKDINAAPTELYLTSDDAHCEKGEKSCNEIPIYGDNFIESDKLACKIRQCKIKPDGLQCNNWVTGEAEYEHIQRVNCHLPSKRKKRAVTNEDVLGEAYYARISNNGANFSEEVVMLVSYSDCIECNTTAVLCVPKQANCYIAGVCYQNGTRNPNDTCKVCDVKSSNLNWSEKTDGNCLSSTPAATSQTSTSATSPTSTVMQSTGSATSPSSSVMQSAGSATSPTSTVSQSAGSATSPTSSVMQSTGSATSPTSSVMQSTGSATSPTSSVSQSARSATSPTSSVSQSATLSSASMTLAKSTVTSTLAGLTSTVKQTTQTSATGQTSPSNEVSNSFQSSSLAMTTEQTMQEGEDSLKKDWIYPVIAVALLVTVVMTAAIVAYCKKTARARDPQRTEYSNIRPPSRNSVGVLA